MAIFIYLWPFNRMAKAKNSIKITKTQQTEEEILLKIPNTETQKPKKINQQIEEKKIPNNNNNSKESSLEKEESKSKKKENFFKYFLNNSNIPLYSVIGGFLFILINIKSSILGSWNVLEGFNIKQNIESVIQLGADFYNDYTINDLKKKNTEIQEAYNLLAEKYNNIIEKIKKLDEIKKKNSNQEDE
jgi:hypothetical protein